MCVCMCMCVCVCVCVSVDGIDEVILSRRNLHNRAAESHEILSECSHQ